MVMTDDEREVLTLTDETTIAVHDENMKYSRATKGQMKDEICVVAFSSAMVQSERLIGFPFD
jgi:hypothetical protein